MKWPILILFAGLTFARPSCGNFPFHDFVWESAYTDPVRPPDTLLDNCENIGVDKAICSEITNPNLTIEEKRQLVLDGLVKNSSVPDFSTSESWDKGISFTKYAPDGVQTYNSANIRDAWLKIVSINPSIYSGNSLLVNGTGEVQAAFNFSFVVQKQSFPEDCATEYEICGYNYALSKGLGNNFANATLTINTRYLIHHSSLVTYCYSTPDGDFCYTVCEYSHSDNIRDSLTIKDNVAVKQYTPTYSAFAFIESYQNGLVDGWLVFNSNASFNSAKFTIGNSYIIFRNSTYSFSANFTPYNSITPKAKNSLAIFGFYGLSILENNGTTIHFLAPVNQLNCSFDFFGHFSNLHEDNFCHLSQDEPIINLTLLNRTNKTILIGLKFYDNISGTALAGKLIALSYGNQSENLTTDADGEAQQIFQYSPISTFVLAEFKTDFKTKSAKAQLVIPSDFPISLQIVIYAISLIVALYLAYKFSKRCNHEN